MNRETSLVKKKYYVRKAPTGTFFLSFNNPYFAQWDNIKQANEYQNPIAYI